MKKLIFLPTYNERSNLDKLIPDILKVCCEADIVVIDDNSTDGTIELVNEYHKKDQRVNVVVRSGQRGRGLTEIDAYRYFIQNDYDLFLEMDADGSHNVKYIPLLFNALATYDISIASRFKQGGKDCQRAKIRVMTSRFIRQFARILLGISFADPSSGFRAFRKDVIQYLLDFKINAEGPAVIIETAALISKSHYKIMEIPIEFEERKSGGSKVTIRTLIIYSLCIIRQVFCRDRKCGGRRSDHNLEKGS